MEPGSAPGGDPDPGERPETARTDEVLEDLLGVSPELVAVLAANQRFYDAFEHRDLDVMSDVWEHSERVWCTHPGWETLRGWGPVVASWFALFQSAERLQFILTNTRADVVGDVAWVTGDENILSGRSGGTVAALNVFVRSDGQWRLVGHHGSSVARRPPE